MNPINLDIKSNSFNFLRLALAILVLIAHSFELGGFGYDPVFYFSQNIYSIGALAVDCFFAISGLLITMSYKKINSLIVFLWHRFLRIFPGYWLCIILTSVLLQSIFLGYSDLSYAKHNFLGPCLTAFQSIIGFSLPLLLGWEPNLAAIADKISIFGQHSIPGVFSGDHINGSLWSLLHEFRLYFLIAFLGLTGLLRKWVIIGIALLSWSIYIYLIYKNPSWSGLAGSSTYRTTAHFLIGSLFYFTKPSFRHTYAILAFISSVIFLKIGLYPIVSPITTAYIIFYLSMIIPFRSFGSRNDFSYGIYVYAFPTQKTLTAFSINQYGILYYFLISLIITFILSVFSWFLIEKNAMKLKYISLAPLLKIPRIYFKKYNQGNRVSQI